MSLPERKAFLIVSRTAHKYAGDIFARAFGMCLPALGYSPIWIWRDSSALPSEDSDIIINFGRGMAEQFRPMKGRKFVYNFHPARRVISGKPLWDAFSERYFRDLQKTITSGHAEAVLEYNLLTARDLNSEGIRAVYTPVGYHETFEVPRREPLEETGVFFLGVTRKKRRPQFIKALNAKVFQGDGATWETQERLLQTDGVHLDIPHVDWRAFLSLRVIMRLLSNKRAVLCEKPEWSPLTHGEHYMEFSPGSVISAKKTAELMLGDP